MSRHDDEQQHAAHNKHKDETDNKHNNNNAKNVTKLQTLTAEMLQSLCRSRADQYTTVELNHTFYINHQALTNVDYINHARFAQLKHLYLDHNNLTNMDFISELHGLQTLILDFNLIRVLTSCSSCPLLTRLSITNNQITSFEHVPTQIKHLNVAHNQLTIVDGIEKVLELQSLDMSHNQLTSEGLVPLQQLKHIKTLYLQHNSDLQQPNLRKHLIGCLSTLTYLNDRPITRDERASCVAWLQGGRDEEKKISEQLKAEKRDKDERNMNMWRQQKLERQQQLASIDTQPSHNIPASSLHEEIARVNYSFEPEQKNTEQQQQHGINNQLTPNNNNNNTESVNSTNTQAASRAETVEAPPDTILSSYLQSDDSDEPEISAMKQMLQDMLIGTHRMKEGIRQGGTAATNASVTTTAAATATVAPTAVATSSSKPIAIQTSSTSKSNALSPPLSPTSPSSPPSPSPYNILQSQTIAQIYEETRSQIPRVDWDSADASDEDGDNTIPIVGFGRDDAHLIDRPFLGAKRDAPDASDDDDMADTSYSWNAHYGSKEYTGLDNMLEQRQRARLGDKSNAAAAAAAAATRSTGSTTTRSTGTATHNVAEDDDVSSPTDTQLMSSFIHAQISEPTLASTRSNDDEHKSIQHSFAHDRQQRQMIFDAAAHALQLANNYERTMKPYDDDDHDDDDDDDQHDDEKTLPVDARAANIEIRRAAKQQQAKKK